MMRTLSPTTYINQLKEKIIMPKSTESPSIANAQFIAGLRELADFYESHPEVPIPKPSYLDFSVYSLHTKSEAAGIIKLLGTITKEYTDSGLFKVVRYFGPIALKFVFNRDTVCERVVVRKEVVPEHVREIVEWKCAPVLAAEGEEG
jgi:hypothetical protein